MTRSARQSPAVRRIAAGRPVLAAAPEGALRDFVADNGFGLVSGPRDIGELAEHMRRLAVDAALRRDLQAAVVEGRGRFSMRRQTEMLSAFLDAR